VGARVYKGKDPKSFGFKHIKYEKNGFRATVTIDRPAVLNAINLDVLQELNIAIKDTSWDDNLAVIILTGAGERAFCTGADLTEQEQFLKRPGYY